MKIDQIIKRDFDIKAFDLTKITEAIHKAMVAVEVGKRQDAQDVSLSVYTQLLERKNKHQEYIPTIEEVQDIVETQLMESKFKDVAKAYILYRNKRSQKRESDIFEKRVNLNHMNILIYMNMSRLLDIHIGYIRNSISQVIFKILNPVCLTLKEAQSKTQC